MTISFPYKTELSGIFGTINRPVANVDFWSSSRKRWLRYTMIVDTGADYTILPYSASFDLDVNLAKQAQKHQTFGIGGSEIVYVIDKYKVRIGETIITVPVGFLKRDNVPPLLGRHKCLDIFAVLFEKFMVKFSR
ncbi:MAG: aspartyl protease family protein [Patescibacteria group bacterium]